MKKSRYIDLMEQVLSAYSNEHIDRYYNDVKSTELTEHGFPRLTANIGILIAHGKRTDLIPRFIKLMDLCCEEIPKRKYAGNEFSIKEIIFSLLELEKNKTLPQAQIDSWKNALKKVTVENCYRVYAKTPEDNVYNWALFGMVSEWMRCKIGAAEKDMDFLDRQVLNQWRKVDENGMYRDPHEPMVYDLVSRGLMALVSHLGYRGKYYALWDNVLERSGRHTLKMLSVSGEIPYGGRSNQFLHNEAHSAIVLEYEAARYAKRGDMKTASMFKAAVKRSLDSISLWLKQEPINHIKNAFPRSTKFGCEHYAYFDKYMITAASFLYAAYLISDDDIPVGELDDKTGVSWQTTGFFHKVFFRAGEYFAQYDYQADYHYDASGLGRLHRKGAPVMVCLSTPGTHQPLYAINAEDPVPFAIAPEVFYSGKWLSGADPAAVHKVEKHGAEGESAFARFSCTWNGKIQVSSNYFLDKNGLEITLNGSENIGLMIPAFLFDGKDKTVISNTGKTLSIRYKGWECLYQVEKGTIRGTGKKGYNRNGHYQIFRAEGKEELVIKVSIQPVK